MFVDGSFSLADHSFVDGVVAALDVSVVCDGGSSVVDNASGVGVEFSSGGTDVFCSDVTWYVGGSAAGAAIAAEEAPVWKKSFVKKISNKLLFWSLRGVRFLGCSIFSGSGDFLFDEGRIYGQFSGYKS